MEGNVRNRIDVTKAIIDGGIIAVIRAPDAEQAFNLAEAAYKGGINAVEITMTVPGGIEIIRELASKYHNDKVIIGAGTILDPETARLSILAGAEYIICPNFNENVIRTSHRYGKACIPGCMSVTEIVEAMECGADLVKVFPADVLGPEFIKDVRGPLPHAMLVPTGGVNIDNVEKWFEAGAVALAVGGELTREAVAKHDFGIMERKAAEFAARVKAARRGKNV